MSANAKIEVVYEVQEDQMEWLEEMADRHNLPSASKALRVLLDFAIEEGNESDIYEKIRCRHCG